MVRTREEFGELHLAVPHLDKDPSSAEGGSNTIVLSGDHTTSMHRVVQHTRRFGIDKNVAIHVFVHIVLCRTHVDGNNPCGVFKMVKDDAMWLPRPLVENDVFTDILG